jgi:hypothetical protein
MVLSHMAEIVLDNKLSINPLNKALIYSINPS